MRFKIKKKIKMDYSNIGVFENCSAFKCNDWEVDLFFVTKL